jgi:hypothetical protein
LCLGDNNGGADDASDFVLRKTTVMVLFSFLEIWEEEILLLVTKNYIVDLVMTMIP